MGVLIVEVTFSKKEILGALEKIPLLDRDLKSIAVYLNPNYINGTDKKIARIVEKKLVELEKLGLVKKEEKILEVFEGKSKNQKLVRKKHLLWSGIYKGGLNAGG